MLKKLLSLLFFCCTFYIQQAQSYHPVFVGDSTIWTYFSINGFSFQYGLESERTYGDTIFNGKKYKRIGDKTGHVNAREDTTNRKIYSYDTRARIEYLLYDFSLNKGDLIQLYEYWANCDYIFKNYRVDTTYMIQTFQGNRKLMVLSQVADNSYKHYWLESVGEIDDKSNYFECQLFNYNRSCPFISDISSFRFICKKDNNTLVYESKYVHANKIYQCNGVFDTCYQKNNTIVSKVDSLLTSSDTAGSYQWLRCDSNYKPILGATNKNYVATKTGYYAVIITKGRCIDTSMCKKYIDTCPPINTTLGATDSSLFSKDTTATGYQWLDCDSNLKPIPLETKRTFVPKRTGLYALIVYKGKCSDTSNCGYFILKPSSIINQKNQIYSIYPNPVQSSLFIQTSQTINRKLNITVYNSLGSIVLGKELELKNNLIEISVNTLPKGHYFLLLHNDTQPQVLKFIKD